MKIHEISPKPLTFEIIEEILNDSIELRISKQSIDKIKHSRSYLEEKVDSGNEAIYGINTGFGSLYNVSVSKEDLSKLQENLVKSHACGTGEEIDSEIVKLMMILKAHALSYGNSGIQLSSVEKLCELFNKGIIPVVYEYGSLGASGDLAPLAHMVLPMLGMGEVNYKGNKIRSEDALEAEDIKTANLGAKEGLAFLNGTQFMSAHGVVSVIKARKLFKIANAISALSLDSYDGRIEPFYKSLHEIRPHNGQIETAKQIRELLNDSDLIKSHKEHVQDPYSFRCIPQVHGATKDAIDHAGMVVEKEINSVTDNPTIFPDEDLIISGGNFHGQALAVVYDYLAIAVSELANISERRTYQLVSGKRNLPSFLVAKPGLNSGFMIPQYTAASIVSSNKQLCTPSSVDSIESSQGQEDHVSMGANAATKLLKVIENTEKVLAIELLTAAQALEFRRPAKSSPKLEIIFKEYRKHVDFVENDTIMYKNINKSVEFVKKKLYKLI